MKNKKILWIVIAVVLLAAAIVLIGISEKKIPDKEAGTGNGPHVETDADAAQHGAERETADKSGQSTENEKPDAGKTGGNEGSETADEQSDKREKISGSGVTEQEKQDNDTDVPANQEDTWEEFIAMTPAQQDAYMQSFSSPADFADWMVRAQKAYAEAHPTEEIGADGTIHIGQ